jgi:microcystin-dependent protein
MKTTARVWMLFLLSLTGSTGWSMPTKITFQGSLKQGMVAYEGDQTMRFRLVDSSGAEIWPGETKSVKVVKGLFSVELSPDPNIDWASRNPFLEIRIGDTALPLQPITANMYALVAKTVVDGSITRNKLDAGLQASVIPPGVILPFASDAVPNGWLLCDGSDVSRTTYSGLFAVVGTTHGSGNGVTTFSLPDYRGRFLRGRDRGAGRDPQASSRAAMSSGGSTGDAVGSIQGDATRLPNNGFNANSSGGHTHQYLRPSTRGGNQAGSNSVPWVIAESEYGTTGNPQGTAEGTHTHAIEGGDAETRPANANVNFIIKY